MKNLSVFFSLLVITFFSFVISSCKTSGSSDPAPASPYSYDWYASLSDPHDTAKIVNDALYLSFAPRDFSGSGPITLPSVAWMQGNLYNDFQLTIDYEQASSFFVTLASYDQQPTEEAIVNISDLYSSIAWESGSSTPDSFDFKSSTSGTITMVRTGSKLDVSIVKNYFNGATPAQDTHHMSNSTFYSGNMSVSFSGFGLNNEQARVKLTHVSMTNQLGNVVTDGFGKKKALYVHR